jgi:hypothetical protein
MKWYAAKLIVECRVGRAHPTLWDQQLVVFRASSATAAYATALTRGRQANHAYRNVTGETVQWRFKGLADLQEVLTKSLRSGTEVYSRLAWRRAPDIPPKSKLTVFWVERNKHRTALTFLTVTTDPAGGGEWSNFAVHRTGDSLCSSPSR